MKVAYFRGPGGVEVRGGAVPAPKGKEALVRVKACGICGSDLHAYQEGEPRWKRLGHEFAGVVEQVGEEVERLQPGDLVAGIGSLPCERCKNCLAGRGQFCLKPQWCGGDAFAEYVCKKEEFFFPTPGLRAEEAALLEPLTVAIELVKDGAIPFMAKVLIMGAGPIGLKALRLCRLAGASKVYVSHPARSRARLKMAREMGADEVICPDKEDLVARVRELEPEGVESVLITARPREVITQAVEVTAMGGTIAFVGMEWQGSAQWEFNVDKFHFSKMRLVGSNHNPCGRLYPQAAELLRGKEIDAGKLITHRFSLTEIEKAFEYVTEHKSEVVKAMITD